ncbi:MAG: transporter substrate-binding domain-containing protein, partial [Pleurocapsa sp. SU_196_0]|nr:transporter substrate-binding domain-containing protein [Pleurocapsa sp. SU_196_0]
MKLRIQGTLLIVAPILAVLGLTVAANSLEDIRALGEIRLGNSADYEPFYFKQNGKLTGFEVELGNALAAKLGVTPSWRTVEFNSLLVTVQQDRLDAAMASHTITAEVEIPAAGAEGVLLAGRLADWRARRRHLGSRWRRCFVIPRWLHCAPPRLRRSRLWWASLIGPRWCSPAFSRLLIFWR